MAKNRNPIYVQADNEQPAAAFNGEPPLDLERDREERLFNELLAKHRSAICTSQELETLDIPARQFLMGQWMRAGDLGFVFGERGHGKTWFVYLLITHLSAGRDIDEDWKVPAPCHVLLVDGEMPLDECRDRLRGLSPGNERIHVLHHERLFDQSGLVLNLSDRKLQRVITELCVQTGAKLLVLDNLSCLLSGVKENDADAWEMVLNWLLDLRRRRIAVLIVHHAGRDGDHMRGTSKREDAAFWVIGVKGTMDRAPDANGTAFETTFTKQRNSPSRQLTRKWSLKTESDGTVTFRCDQISFDGKVLELIQAGLRSATEIADELNVAKSTVSKAAQRLVDKKLIERRGNANRATYEPRGFMA